MWILLSHAFAGPCAAILDHELTPVGMLDEAGTGLASIQCAMDADPALQVRVEVHTDSRGSSTYNLAKSQQRADGLRDALVALGVPEKRLTSVGYGELYPLAANSTSAGRSSNSRVEFRTDAARPRAPEPSPQPAPAPVAEDAWCTDLANALAAGRPQTWTRNQPISTVVKRMSACLDPGWRQTRDGDALYAIHDAWLVRVEPTAEDARVTLEASR